MTTSEIVDNQDVKYRLHDGEIQLQAANGKWVRSAHDGATESEIREYAASERRKSLVPLLQQKFAKPATP